jgi:hypothetical protein
VLRPEEARERIAAQRLPDQAAARRRAVEALPEPLRSAGSTLCERPYPPFDAPLQSAIETLQGVDEEQRRRLFAALFPRLDVHVERCWQLLAFGPYQGGGERRPFRAPGDQVLTQYRRLTMLTDVVRTLRDFDPDAVWLARWAEHIPGRWGASFACLLAAASDGGDAEADEVFAVLAACATGEDEIGLLGHDVIGALLRASREDGWEIVERLLLDAGRQEGLRQSILEAVDLAHPTAFRRALTLIAEHELTRFSSVARAVSVWFGIELAAGETRRLDAIIARVRSYLDDVPARVEAVRSGDGEDAYLALWSVAFEDAHAACTLAEPLIADRDPGRRIAAAHLLAQVRIHESYELLVSMLADDDLRVAVRSFEAFRYPWIRREWPGLFDQLEALLMRCGKAPRDIEFLWLGGTWVLTQDDVADRLLQHGSAEPIERLAPHVSQMSSDGRWTFASRLAQEEPRPELGPVILQLLASPAVRVREGALKAATRMPPPTHEEAHELEQLLKRKDETLRTGVITLLLRQVDADVLSSADRLLAGDARKRLAGLELLRRLTASDRSAGAARTRARAVERERASVAESLQLDAILTSQAADVASVDPMLGLVDQARLTERVAPVDRGVALMTPAAAAALTALDELVHEQRETQVTLRGDVVLLGDVQYLPGPLRDVGGARRADGEAVASPPLGEIWLDWERDRSRALRDADDLELVRALVFLNMKRARVPAVAALTGGVTVPRIRYPAVVHGVVEWLVVLRPTAGLEAFVIDAAETLLAAVPDEELREPVSDSWREPGWRLRGWYGYLDLVRQLAVRTPGAFTHEQWQRLWSLERWAQGPVPDSARLVPHSGPPLSLLLVAHGVGVATDDDVTEHLLRWRRDLDDVSGRRPRWYELDPAPAEIVDRIRRRAVEVELQRGEAPTPATSVALRLRSTGGFETLERLLVRLGGEPLARGWSFDGASATSVLTHLVRGTSPGEEDTPACVAPALRAIGSGDERLVELACFAPQWAAHVEQALGWDGLATAVWWMHAHTKDRDWRIDWDVREAWTAEVAERTPLSGEELQRGAVDVDWFRSASTALGPERWKVLDVAARYCSTGPAHLRARLFADAMLCRVDEATLLGRIREKRHQDPVRALGLLPLPEGDGRDAAVLARYELMQDFLRGSRQFGAQRQQSERAAVEIGLANLARSAGYRDPLRLSWAMEARGVADLADGPLREDVDGVELALSLDELGAPQLAVSRDGKQLKAVPAGIRSRPAVKALRARSSELRRQGSRVRLSLEEAMVRGELFSGDELHALSAHAVLFPQLRRLILVGEGIAGYPAASGRTLTDHAGAEHAIGHGEQLRVAHPLDLLALGFWHAWQRDCLARGVVQPFKQVFRELYVPTRDERGQTVSRRYAGNQLDGRRALGVLRGRGWVAHPEEGIRKTLHAERITATLWFLNTLFTPGEVEDATVEAVLFHPSGAHEPLAIDAVPGRVFSEIMRDLDLLVSVAHSGGVDPETSTSTIEMRGALVRETGELLGLANVRVEEPWVLVDGALGDWSIHLGSANVHRRPGGAVCIVPVHGQHRGRIFLPFADEEPKTAEVVAKVLLLAKDREIRDPTILEQLRS